MIVTKRIGVYRGKLMKEKFEHEVKAEVKLSDIVYNIDTVKYFQRQQTEITIFTKIIEVRNK